MTSHAVCRAILFSLLLIFVTINVFGIYEKSNMTVVSMRHTYNKVVDDRRHKSTMKPNNEREHTTTIKPILTSRRPHNTKMKSRTISSYVKTTLSWVFLFSAVVIDKTPTYYFHTSYNDTVRKELKEYKEKMILVNGWVYKNVIKPRCCLYLNNGEISDSPPLSQRTFKDFTNLLLRSTQFKCRLTEYISMIKGVSIATNNRPCVKSEYYYIKPIPQIDCDLTDVAVCSKLTFGSVKAEVLLEWFEIQRLLGVKKVITYTYKLNKKAMDVLNYYESIGLAVIFRDFDFPAKETFIRDVPNETWLAWNDEHVVINDCQARLNGYKYVAMMDKDEFIVPTNIAQYNFSMKAFLDTVFTDKIAGITMMTVQHITSWGPSNNVSKLYIGRYTNSTAPIEDRNKYIYMPTRVKSGFSGAHDVEPHTGYSRKMLPVQLVSLHHYRSCRKGGTYWIPHDGFKEHRKPDIIFNNKHSDPCTDFKRYNNFSTAMDNIITAIQGRVIKLKDILRIT